MLPHNITQYQGCTCKSFYLNSIYAIPSVTTTLDRHTARFSFWVALFIDVLKWGRGAWETRPIFMRERICAGAHPTLMFLQHTTSTQTQTRHQLSEDLQTSTGTQPPLLLQFLIYLHSESRWRCEGDSCWCCYQKLQWSSWLVCLPLH